MGNATAVAVVLAEDDAADSNRVSISKERKTTATDRSNARENKNTVKYGESVSDRLVSSSMSKELNMRRQPSSRGNIANLDVVGLVVVGCCWVRVWLVEVGHLQALVGRVHMWHRSWDWIDRGEGNGEGSGDGSGEGSGEGSGDGSGEGWCCSSSWTSTSCFSPSSVLSSFSFCC